MFQQLKKIAYYIAIPILIAFLLFVFNQLMGLYNNLYPVGPIFALVVVLLVAIVILGAMLTPMVLVARLPKALVLPQDEEGEQAYREALSKRLSKNKLLKEEKIDLQGEAGLKQAVGILSEQADKAIHRHASNIFLATAISQNGKLDAFAVLVTQARMVWQIAHIFWQRPAIKDMANLYANVAGTAFLAAELEGIDLTRQIEPVVKAIVKSPGKSIPLVGNIAHVVTDSLLQGSTNAFFALRVGLIAKGYCAALSLPEHHSIKEGTLSQASKMLKSVVGQTSTKVIKSIVQATKDTGAKTIKNGMESVNKAASNVKDGFVGIAGKFKK